MTAPIIEGVTDLQEIGRGGFGVVYRGHETAFGRYVAVKVLLPTVDDRMRRRFERERRAMGAVSGHPHIVTVYRGGITEANEPYLVMEYLPGGSLADRLQQVGPMDWRDAGTIGAKLAGALSDSHRSGILHRDVKPGNIFMTQDGEPKLGDFGIARLDDGLESRTGSITASVAHAPPEIIDGQRGDERSDLYSLASTIYALTIGVGPFSRDPDVGLAHMLSAITSQAPPPLHLESAANEFETVLLRGLNKRPDDRQATVQLFGNQLQRAVSGSTPPPAQAAATSIAASSSQSAETQSPSVPTGAPAPPSAQAIDQYVQAQEAAAPTRAGNGQLLFLAALALLIFGFGGWAVARAVFADGDTQVVEVERTPDPEEERPTATPVAVATAIPRPDPTAAPTATAVPAATPEPEPTTTGDVIPGTFARVVDTTGAISITVPGGWQLPRFDNDDLVDPSGALMTFGGRPAIFAADDKTDEFPGERDFTVEGGSVIVNRFPQDVTNAALIGFLELTIQGWEPECVRAERTQQRMPNGLAQYQQMACASDDGSVTGLYLVAFAHEDDPEVFALVTLQLVNFDADDAALATDILLSVDVDPTKIP